MRISSAGKTSSAPLPTRATTAGITLMEMVVVMAIIGLLTAIVAPSIGAGIESVRLSTATGSLSAFLNSAVNYSERRQQAVEIVIALKENRLSAYSFDGGFTRDLSLPEGITLEAVQPEIAELVLLPGATIPGIGFQVANRRGSRRLVKLDPMTGFPRVSSVEKK